MVYYESNRSNPTGGIYHQHSRNLRVFRHLHDSFEFLYISRGMAEITVDDCAFSVSAGHGILIFPNQIHSLGTPTESEIYVCVFQNSLVGEFYGMVKDMAAKNPVFEIPDPSLIEQMERESSSRYFLKARLYELIGLFERSGGELVRRNKPMEHMEQILRFISEHYAEPITMQNVAREIGYDHHYLSNLLQKGLHTTFRALLNEYRISHAQFLLLEGQESVAAVAELCGYDSLCSFNRNFKRITATTPTDYREEWQTSFCKESITHRDSIDKPNGM